MKKYQDTVTLVLYKLKIFFEKFIEISFEFISLNLEIFIQTEKRYHPILNLASLVLTPSNTSDPEIISFIGSLTMREFNEFIEKYNSTYSLIKSSLKHFEEIYNNYNQNKMRCLKNMKESRDPKYLSYIEIKEFNIHENLIENEKFLFCNFLSVTSLFEHLLTFQWRLKQGSNAEDDPKVKLEKTKSISYYLLNFRELKNVRFFNLIYSINNFCYMILKIMDYLKLQLNKTSFFLRDIYVTDNIDHTVIRTYTMPQLYRSQFHDLINNYQYMFSLIKSHEFNKHWDISNNYFVNELENYYFIIGHKESKMKSSVDKMDSSVDKVFFDIDCKIISMSEHLKNEWDNSIYNINNLEPEFINMNNLEPEFVYTNKIQDIFK